MPFENPASPHRFSCRRTGRRVAAAITETLTTGALTLGPWTKQFEAAFAAAHQTPNAIAVASGTCALEIILRATDVAGGDVIVPANTFYATAAAVLRACGKAGLR